MTKTLLVLLLAAGTAHAAPRRAKNIILFLGDGMSATTVAAARILEGQLRGQTGEENLLSFERFPRVAFSKTYTTDHQVPDSAGTMSAIVTGVKTKSGAISVDPEDRRVTTIFEIAEKRGMSTGFVTTARLTHATPAACYGHAASRASESEADPRFGDLASQMIAFPFEVALGGGRAHFLPETAVDPEDASAKGARKDGRDLTREWVEGSGRGAVYAWNRAQFDAAPPTATRLLGIFAPSHMAFEGERARDIAGEPSLADMTVKAIQMLSRNPKGYVLMVEGGRIDHGHHAGRAALALTETIAMAKAVEAALRSARVGETLIIVTADHSHVMTMGGYPKRGNPILGKVVTPSGIAKDTNGLPFTTLMYANGPGYRNPRIDLTSVDTASPEFQQDSGLPLTYESHGGEDVPVYATGPGSERLGGVIEQNKIFDIMLEAIGRR